MTQKHKCAVCGRRDVRLYRIYSRYLHEDEIRCKKHIPKDKAKWYVPLVEATDGTVWGYTAAPPGDTKRFNDLPEAEEE